MGGSPCSLSAASASLSLAAHAQRSPYLEAIRLRLSLTHEHSGILSYKCREAIWRASINGNHSQEMRPFKGDLSAVNRVGVLEEGAEPQRAVRVTVGLRQNRHKQSQVHQHMSDMMVLLLPSDIAQRLRLSFSLRISLSCSLSPNMWTVQSRTDRDKRKHSLLHRQGDTRGDTASSTVRDTSTLSAEGQWYESVVRITCELQVPGPVPGTTQNTHTLQSTVDLETVIEVWLPLLQSTKRKPTDCCTSRGRNRAFHRGSLQ